MVALAIASTWLLVRAREKETKTAWASYGLVLLVMLIWQAFSALLLPVHVIAARGYRRALFSWAIVGVLALPWILILADREGGGGGPTTWLERPSLGVIAAAIINVAGAVGVGAVVGIIGLVLVRRHRTLLGTWALLPFALALAGSLYKPVFLDRYLIICSPAFALLGAIALTRLAGRFRLMALGALAATTIVALQLWYAPDGSDNWRGENWKAATAFAMTHWLGPTCSNRPG